MTTPLAPNMGYLEIKDEAGRLVDDLLDDLRQKLRRKGLESGLLGYWLGRGLRALIF